jgi:hypothetical protein
MRQWKQRWMRIELMPHSVKPAGQSASVAQITYWPS